SVLAIGVVSSPKLVRMFHVPGLLRVPIFFASFGTSSLTILEWGVFLTGITTIGQLSFWGNYLPRVYPTHLRGTGESFAANVGGRMIGTCAALLTTQLVNVMPGATPPTRLAHAAAIVGTRAY